MVDVVADKNFQTEQQIVNKNFLSPIGYRFFVKKLPFTNFFVQRANVPGISLGTLEIPSPFINTPDQGDHLSFNELRITFKVDEDLTNYIEVYNWIRQASVISFDEFRGIANKPKMSGEGLKSDMTLTILTSKRNPNFNLNFVDAWPASLSDLEFDTTNESVDFIEATVLFRYQQYNFEKVV